MCHPYSSLYSWSQVPALGARRGGRPPGPLRLLLALDALAQAVAQAVALARERQDMGMKGEPVQQRGGEALVAEDLRPVSELEGGSDDETGLLVEGGGKAEEQGGAGLTKRNETHLIEHQQVEAEE